MYCSSKSSLDWKTFKETVKRTKRSFFDKKIQEIVSRKKQSWDFINWVKKYKLSATKAIQFNGYLCIELGNLWEVLYQTFN